MSLLKKEKPDPVGLGNTLLSCVLNQGLSFREPYKSDERARGIIAEKVYFARIDDKRYFEKITSPSDPNLDGLLNSLFQERTYSIKEGPTLKLKPSYTLELSGPSEFLFRNNDKLNFDLYRITLKQQNDPLHFANLIKKIVNPPHHPLFDKDEGEGIESKFCGHVELGKWKSFHEMIGFLELSAAVQSVVGDLPNFASVGKAYESFVTLIDNEQLTRLAQRRNDAETPFLLKVVLDSYDPIGFSEYIACLSYFTDVDHLAFEFMRFVSTREHRKASIYFLDFYVNLVQTIVPKEIKSFYETDLLKWHDINWPLANLKVDR
ncbi:MAG: hypothetical protein H6623_05325 [Bdellovibrionaceae bacterium]|nr:hypothetical protein [Pseudobdellovibrionaceae bacterium]